MYTEKDYLAHYGVKGMRRGQRRTPRDMAQISGPTRGEAGEVHDAVGDHLYRSSPVYEKQRHKVNLGPSVRARVPWNNTMGRFYGSRNRYMTAQRNTNKAKRNADKFKGRYR